jgi:hypothetical protein
MLLLFTMACLENGYDIQLSGRVRTSQESSEPASNITVESLNSTLGLHAETKTDDAGMFQVAAQANSAFHLHFSGQGFRDTSFSGVIGNSDLALGDDHIFLRSNEDIDALRILHENCPQAEDEGGIVEGIVKFPILSDATGDTIVAQKARVIASHQDGQLYETCYLDDDGASLTTGGRVGATGLFAIFGVNDGAISIEFQQDIGSQILSNYVFATMPDNGIVPLFPVFIDLPS